MEKKKITIAIVLGIMLILVLTGCSNNKVNESINNIGEGATNFIKGIENANSHLNEFVYDYNTNTVLYKPTITLEKYNSIEEGMTEEQVISILGNPDNREDRDYMIKFEWGNILNTLYEPYIYVYFDTNHKVTYKGQLDLE